MWKSLDQIAWIAWENPQIPIWIKELASGDGPTRDRAFGYLCNELTRWEVFDGLYNSELSGLVKRETPHLVIPFLINVLEHEGTEGKELVLDLLRDLARYVDLDSYVAEEYREQYRYHAGRLYDAVRKGIRIYEKLVGSDVAAVDQAAKRLLKTVSLRRLTF
jgi:hypothetical protein